MDLVDQVYLDIGRECHFLSSWVRQNVIEETIGSHKVQIYCHPRQLKIISGSKMLLVSSGVQRSY